MDRRMRELERQAKAGDPDAAAQWERAQRRAQAAEVPEQGIGPVNLELVYNPHG